MQDMAQAPERKLFCNLSRVCRSCKLLVQVQVQRLLHSHESSWLLLNDTHDWFEQEFELGWVFNGES